MINKPVILCILDGFGYRQEKADNAIKLASMPVYENLWETMPRAWLKTSGPAVGLPPGQMGNSEVGHTCLGSGRIILQDLPKINQAIEDGTLKTNTQLNELITASQMAEATGVVHLMGLLSDGGVHSHQDHIIALARILLSHGLTPLIHAFLDGRDTPPRSAKQLLERFEAQLPSGSRIATISGRYYAMDRDNRWNRVKKAYLAISRATGDAFDSANAAINAAYSADTSDEFVTPAVIGDYKGIQSGDSLLMANFRADRAREILAALIDPDFTGFDRDAIHHFSSAIGMVQYSSHLDTFMPALFPSEMVEDSLGEVLESASVNQLRLAETEKYAHVTFFFNGGSETVFKGEDRILVPSPDVATYDLKPEMSAFEVTAKLIEAIKSGKYGAIIVNYANPDMVGHTGNLDAAIKAVETIDVCLGAIMNAAQETNAAVLITADHGNVELMRDPGTGGPHTAHTDFDVPLIMAHTDIDTQYGLKDGTLSDIAPTILNLLGLKKPDIMTGQSLLLSNKP